MRLSDVAKKIVPDHGCSVMEKARFHQLCLLLEMKKTDPSELERRFLLYIDFSHACLKDISYLQRRYLAKYSIPLVIQKKLYAGVGNESGMIVRSGQ